MSFITASICNILLNSTYFLQISRPIWRPNWVQEGDIRCILLIKKPHEPKVVIRRYWRGFEILLFIQKCKIYLPSDVAEIISNYFNACFQLADIYRKNEGLTKENSAEATPYIKIEKELAPKIEIALLKLLNKAQ